MKGSEEESNLPAIRGAIGPKFSGPNQRLTEYERCEPHNHASNCRSSSNLLIDDDVDPVYPAKLLLHHFRRTPAS